MGPEASGMRKRIRRAFGPVASLATALAGLLLAAPAAAAGPVPVDVQPSTASVDVGSTTTLDVAIGSGSSELYAANFELAFDAAVIDVTDVAFGALLQGNGQEDTAGGFFSDVTIDDSGGSAIGATTLLNPAVPAVSGGTLAQITVLCLAAGSTSLTFSTLVLSDQDGATVASTNTGGSVTCNAVASSPPPVPTLSVWGMLALAVALVVIGFVGARRPARV